MKFIISIVALSVSFCLHAQVPSREEQMLESLKQAGVVRQEGKTIIYKVQKASDTAKVRLLYENLFNNPNYNVRFEIDGKTYEKQKQSQQKNTPPVNGTVNNTVSNQTQPINNSTANANAPGNCCMCNMKVFQYMGTYDAANINSVPFKEYIWTVPSGVTSIKIEGWSAGGDGWEGNDYNEQGGGGGGGAYVLIILKVQAGDIFKIRIPRGGSNYPISVNLTGVNTGTITLTSGRNGLERQGVNRFNGEGGKLLMNSGVFSENIFAVKGEDGEKSYGLTIKQPDRSGAMALLGDYHYYGGKGGAAPYMSTGGGKGSFYETFDYKKIHPGNGGYPGGGGGGGCIISDLHGFQKIKSGYGANGALIIYY